MNIYIEQNISKDFEGHTKGGFTLCTSFLNLQVYNSQQPAAYNL